MVERALRTVEISSEIVGRIKTPQPNEENRYLDRVVGDFARRRLGLGKSSPGVARTFNSDQARAIVSGLAELVSDGSSVRAMHMRRRGYTSEAILAAGEDLLGRPH